MRIRSGARRGAGAGAVAKVVWFAAVLAVVFGSAWAAGAQVGPIGSTPDHDSPEHDSATDSPEHDHATDRATDDTTVTGSGSTVPGLATAQDGYRLVLADTTLEAGTQPIAFAIEGPDGRRVTAFDVEHEKRLHLIVVRRDHTGFQHLHPKLDETAGTWTAQARLTPGAWRVFADFTATDGPALVLGSDLLVPGRLGAPAPTGEARSDVVDGYTVTVEGTLEPEQHSELTFRVSRGDAPVTDLQPYLGAYGHLVALREGDLAYLHVHPGGVPGDGGTEPGPAVEFGAEVPSAGRYHLYLDFQRDDRVRTAHLVLDAGPAARTAPDAGPRDRNHADHTH